MGRQAGWRTPPPPPLPPPPPPFYPSRARGGGVPPSTMSESSVPILLQTAKALSKGVPPRFTPASSPPPCDRELPAPDEQAGPLQASMSEDKL